MKVFQIIFIVAFLIIANRNTEELAIVTIYKQVFCDQPIKKSTLKQEKIKEETTTLKTVET